jgi:hypothetical protein
LVGRKKIKAVRNVFLMLFGHREKITRCLSILMSGDQECLLISLHIRQNDEDDDYLSSNARVWRANYISAYCKEFISVFDEG